MRGGLRTFVEIFLLLGLVCTTLIALLKLLSVKAEASPVESDLPHGNLEGALAEAAESKRPAFLPSTQRRGASGWFDF